MKHWEKLSLGMNKSIWYETAKSFCKTRANLSYQDSTEQKPSNAMGYVLCKLLETWLVTRHVSQFEL